MASPSSPPLAEEDVRRIAALAHLDLTPEEAARMTQELDRILAYVRQLEEIDVSDIAPTAHVQIDRLYLRPDEPEPSLPSELALREAPRVFEGGFAVPGFVDEG